MQFKATTSFLTWYGSLHQLKSLLNQQASSRIPRHREPSGPFGCSQSSGLPAKTHPPPSPPAFSVSSRSQKLAAGRLEAPPTVFREKQASSRLVEEATCLRGSWSHPPLPAITNKAGWAVIAFFCFPLPGMKIFLLKRRRWREEHHNSKFQLSSFERCASDSPTRLKMNILRVTTQGPPREMKGSISLVAPVLIDLILSKL